MFDWILMIAGSAFGSSESDTPFILDLRMLAIIAPTSSTFFPAFLSLSDMVVA